MSLDVYLTMPEPQELTKTSGIFVRRNGGTEEITREEWDALYPDREPYTVAVADDDDGMMVYSRNVTHNLGRMASHACQLYEAMWRPDEQGWKRARDLIEPLRDGLAILQSDPEKFEAFNPANGWGDYDILVEFAADYLRACLRWPDAEVSVWR